MSRMAGWVGLKILSMNYPKQYLKLKNCSLAIVSFLIELRESEKFRKRDALAYGLTGPNLRASGVDLDLRKDNPYSGYEQYDFDVPIGTRGDCYDQIPCTY